MTWSEPLPEQCPPSNANSTDGIKVYRAVTTNPATLEDFKSYRELFPNKSFPVSECQCRSLSVHDKLEATQQLVKLPRFKNNGFYIMELNLSVEDGMILKTNGPNHFSWWKTTHFDFINREIIV